jgi:hypothetical protein
MCFDSGHTQPGFFFKGSCFDTHTDASATPQPTISLIGSGVADEEACIWRSHNANDLNGESHISLI